MLGNVGAGLLCCLVMLTPSVSLGATGSEVVVPPADTDANEKVNELRIDLNMLSHGENRDGGLSSSEIDNKSRFIMGRERLILDYHRQGLDTRLNIQHNGVWGQSGKGAFNIFEAWARMSARNGLFAQIGRVALAYDDQRIIGTNDWAMASLSHDVLRVGYEGHGHKAHLILAYNQNAENLTLGGNFYENGAQYYKSMLTAWYHYDVPRLPLGASLLFMNIGMQAGNRDNDPHVEYQQLLGGYVSYRPNHWIFEGSYYRQFGHSEEGLKIEAWMASAKADWSPNTRYGLEAGYDFLSGDEYFAVPPSGSIGYVRQYAIKGFNPIYGSHHKFYGAMDFFYVSTYVFGFTPGLQNAFIGAHFQPIKGLSLKADYHYLAIAADLTDMDKTLGHEVELQGRYAFSKDISLSLGFSYMTGTETMDKLKRANGDGSLRWGWFSLIVNPRILSTRW
jgi:hypothetical protein